MLRERYRTLLPLSVRTVVFRARRAAADCLHEARWRLLPEPLLSAWVERCLGGPWCFVLGVNNSGTTVLEKLLGAHPGARGLPREGQHLTRALPLPDDSGLARLWGTRLESFRWTEETDAAAALRARYDWARHFALGPGVLVEKSPPDTVRARWLQRHFRPASFIAIVRHPYAVCEGIRRRTGCSLEEAATHWVRANECLLADAPHLERLLWLRYEDLCDAPGTTLEKVRAFLGLAEPFDPASLLGLRIHNIDERPSDLANFNGKSLERLSAVDLETIGRSAAPLMARFGYDVAPART